MKKRLFLTLSLISLSFASHAQLKVGLGSGISPYSTEQYYHVTVQAETSDMAFPATVQISSDRIMTKAGIMAALESPNNYRIFLGGKAGYSSFRPNELVEVEDYDTKSAFGLVLSGAAEGRIANNISLQANVDLDVSNWAMSGIRAHTYRRDYYGSTGKERYDKSWSANRKHDLSSADLGIYIYLH